MAKQNRGAYIEPDPETGIFQIHWCVKGRNRKRSTFTTDRGEATRALGLFLLEGEKAQQEQVKEQAATGTLRVNQILDWYLAEHVEEGPGAGKVTTRTHIRHLRSHFGELPIKAVNHESVMAYKAVRAVSTRKTKHGTPLKGAQSEATLRRELGCLATAFNFAVKTSRLEKIDVPYIALPPPPPAKDLWLHETESPQLMAAAVEYGNERGRLFVAIAGETASRREAIEELTWEQIDLDSGLIHFNPAGRRQTNKRRVPVPISRRLMPELLRVPEKDRTGYVLFHTGDVTSVFHAIRDLAYRTTGNRKFARVTPHTLRHTWATQAARAGVPLWEIAGVLGDSLETVRKNYLHHCPEHLRSAVDARNIPDAYAPTTAVARPAPAKRKRVEEWEPSPG
jgi:integrase